MGRGWTGARWVAAGVAAAGVISLVLLGILLSRWVDGEGVKSALCNEIQRATGLRATIENVRLASLARLEVEGRGLSLRDVRGTPLLEVFRVGVRLKWAEALKGNLVFRSVSLDGVALSWEEGGFASGESSGVFRTLVSSVGQVQISNGRVRWMIKGQPAEIRGFRADFWSSETGQHLGFHGRGEALVGGNALGFVRGKGEIRAGGEGNVELEWEPVPLGPLFRTLFPGVDSLAVSGQARLTLRLEGDRQEGRCEVAWSGKRIRVAWPGMLSVPFDADDASGFAEGRWTRRGWTISRVSAQGGDYSLDGELEGDAEGFRGAIRSGPFPFLRVIPHLGEELVGGHLHAFFRENLSAGEGRTARFSFSRGGWGGAKDGISLVMEMDFHGAALSFDPRLQPLRDLEGTLVWQGDRVWFRDLRGSYLGHVFRLMEAKIGEIGRASLLQGRFVLELSPREMEELFQTVAEKKPGESLASGLSGRCTLDLSLEKTFLKPTPLQYKALVTVTNIAGSLPQLPGPWRISSGALEATPQRLVIRDLQGALEGSSWTLRGGLEGWSGQESKLNLEGTLGIPGADLARAVAGLAPGLKILPVGTSSLSFSLRGPLREPLVTFAWDLGSARMEYAPYWEKAEGTPMAVEGWLLKSPTGAWRLLRGTIRDGHGKVQVEGWLGGREGERNWLQISGRDYPTEGLTQQIPRLRGKMQGGKVDFQGEIYLGADSHWVVTLHPRRVSFPGELLGHEILIRSGALVWARGWGQADPLEVEVQGKTYTLRGRVRPWEQGFSFQGRLVGEEVDLDSWVFPPGGAKAGEAEESQPFPLKRWLLGLPSSQLDFEFQRLKLLDFVFRGVKGRLSTREGKVVMENGTGLLEGGRVALEGYLDGEGDFWLSGGVDEASSGSVLAALGFREEMIDGALFLQTGIEGRLRGKRASKHHGQIELEIQKGVIRKFPVLANILSVMNLTQILTGKLPDLSSEGMVFRKISGSFSLDQGVAKTEDFRVESESVVLTMVGEVDVNKKSCDLKVGVQPFVGFDWFVNKLPVIRHYLAGPDKTVLSTYFLVRGPLGDPKVTAVPFRSLGEGIMGIFKRFLQNPFRDLGEAVELTETPGKEGTAP